MTEYLTKQEVFDTVKAHLLAQGDQAMDNGECVYWDRDHDMKCAVGCLIPEKVYREGIEGFGVREIQDFLKDYCNIDTEETGMLDLLEQLQSMHDRDEPNTWSENLKEIKKEFNLE